MTFSFTLTADKSPTPLDTRVAIFEQTGSKTLYYPELEVHTNQFAHLLLRQYPTCKRIALFLSQSVDYIEAFIGIYKAGFAVMPISPDTENPAQVLGSFLQGGAIDLIISNSQYQNHPFFETDEAKVLPTLLIDEIQANLETFPQTIPQIARAPDDVAYIINTSGTTRKPKQVLISEQGLENCRHGHIETLGITQTDRIAAYADPSFDAHISEILMGLYGASLYIVPSEYRRDYQRLTSFYKRHRITVGVFVASMLRQCDPADFPSLRIVICTGEKIDEGIIRKWGNLLLVDGYGPSEFTIATWLKIIKYNSETNQIVNEMNFIPGVRPFILNSNEDGSLTPVTTGQGMLYLGGPGLAIGYTDPELTASSFVTISDPDAPSEKIRTFKTGDLVQYNSDGCLDIVGREGRRLKVYGRQIYPEGIECVIKEIEPKIKRVYVDAKLTADGHPDFVAYIELMDSQDTLDYNLLYDRLQEQLSQIYIPTGWAVVESLEALGGEKTSIARIIMQPGIPIKRIQNFDPALPQNDLERDLAAMFLQLLGITATDFTLSRHDDFFRLGGKSLQGIVLLNLIRSQYGLRLTYAQLKLVPTVAQLAMSIQRLQAKNQISPLISLFTNYEENSNAPLILLPSLLGDAEVDYEKLISHWAFPRSVFALSARGRNNIADMDRDLDAIAYDYYLSIRDKFPRGLKIIAGWSMGGIMAFRVKQFFDAFGDKSVVALMIDSECPAALQNKSPMAYAKLLHEIFEIKLSGQLNLKKSPISIEALAKFSKEEQVLHLFSAANSMLTEPALDYKRGLLITVQQHMLGILKFRLPKYTTRIGLITAKETVTKCDSDVLNWPQHVQIELIPVSGNHDSIMLEDKNVEIVAQHIGDYCSRQQEHFVAHQLINKLRSHVLAAEEIKDLQYYIPAKGCANNNYSNSFELSDYLATFFQGQQKVLLLLGSGGAGKSMFCKYIVSQIQKKPLANGATVLYIPLPHYGDPTHNLIENHLARLGFSKHQIEHLKKHQKFVFILDGYDEIDQGRHQNLYATNRLEDWDAQVIIACRNSYLFNAPNYRLHFYPIRKNKPILTGLAEVTLVPFDDSQIERYISVFLKEPPEDVEIDDEWKEPSKYMQHIDNLPGLKELIGNPFLLRILMEVLPSIAQTYQDLPAQERTRLTQTTILDAFMTSYWLRQAVKLMLAGQMPEDGEDIIAIFEEYSIELAKKMKLNNVTQILYRRGVEPWEQFFGNKSKDMERAREGCTLKRISSTAKNEQVIGFIHPLLIEYFVNRGLYKDFKDSSAEATTDIDSYMPSQTSTSSSYSPGIVVPPEIYYKDKYSVQTKESTGVTMEEDDEYARELEEAIALSLSMQRK